MRHDAPIRLAVMFVIIRLNVPSLYDKAFPAFAGKGKENSACSKKNIRLTVGEWKKNSTHKAKMWQGRTLKFGSQSVSQSAAAVKWSRVSLNAPVLWPNLISKRVLFFVYFFKVMSSAEDGRTSCWDLKKSEQQHNPGQSPHLSNPIMQTWKYEAWGDLRHWLFITATCCSYQTRA